MRIKSLLALTTAASLAMLLTMVGSLVFSSSALRKASANLALAVAVRATLLERIILRDEYYIRREDRAKTRLIAKSNNLSIGLEEARTKLADAEDQRLISELMFENAASLNIYREIFSTDKAANGGGAESAAMGEYGKRLFSQLLIKSYILNYDASRLESRRFDDVAKLKRDSDFLLSACLTLIIILVLGNSFLIGRILSRGIKKLQIGASKIGDGDLEYRIVIDTRDEIAEVAGEINMMAESLQGSVTSIKDLDERIALRTAELGASNRELEAFAYSVAHDLRAPLRSIEGFSRIVQEESGPALDEEGRRLLGIVRDCAREMDTLISDLLEIARLGRTELNRAMIDMASMARSVFASIIEGQAVKDFDFVVADIPAAFGDALLIERVWSNLIANAVKYSLPSRVHRIEISSYEEGDMNVYSVKDQGVGFDDRYKDKLFGMFQRLHDRKDFEGTGVGLAIVDRVVKRHGGKVWAEGRVGEGAVFHFSLLSGR